jgi:hypothetical protein
MSRRSRLFVTTAVKDWGQSPLARVPAFGEPGFDLNAYFLTIAVGTSTYGGFFAGILDTNQSGAIDADDDYQTPLRYALIVGPSSIEASVERSNVSGQGTLAWRTSNATVSGASTRWNGLAAQNALASATYPAFNYCAGLSYPDDGGSKWYVPALDELELLYRNFKPTTDTNTTASRSLDVFPTVNWTNGSNNASDPTGATYTATVPGQTSLSDWQSGQAQAFTSGLYWSASWRGSTTTWRQSLTTGAQTGNPQTDVLRVRPVRRVLL